MEQCQDEIQMLQILENETFSINDTDPESGNGLLHVAAASKSRRVVAFLLRQKADPLQQNFRGFYPINITVENSDVTTLAVFEEFDETLLTVKAVKPTNGGIAMVHLDDRGASLIHFAILHNAVHVVEYLVSQNPKCVNDICYYGDVKGASVIHLACSKWLQASQKEEESMEKYSKGLPPKKTNSTDDESLRQSMMAIVMLCLQGRTHCRTFLF